jgi:hypothetical protein
MGILHSIEREHDGRRARALDGCAEFVFTPRRHGTHFSDDALVNRGTGHFFEVLWIDPLDRDFRLGRRREQRCHARIVSSTCDEYFDHAIGMPLEQRPNGVKTMNRFSGTHPPYPTALDDAAARPRGASDAAHVAVFPRRWASDRRVQDR